MRTCCDPSGYRRMFGARTAEKNADAYRKSGLDATAKEVVRVLRERGIEGLSVLEIGGGVGAIQLELLRAGAARATNVELSPEYEATAAELAGAAGVADRLERVVGDFVDLAPTIPASDVVVMHRVICCYPYLDRLLGPAADRARQTLALTFPRATPWIRAALSLGNLWFRLTRCSFRVFVFEPAEVGRIASERGLRGVFRRRGLVWETAIYARSA